VAFASEGCGSSTCSPLTTIHAGASTFQSFNPNQPAGVVVDDGRMLVTTNSGLVAYGLPG